MSGASSITFPRKMPTTLAITIRHHILRYHPPKTQFIGSNPPHPREGHIFFTQPTPLLF